MPLVLKISSKFPLVVRIPADFSQDFIFKAETMFPAHQLQLEQLACQRGDRVLFTDLSLQFQSGDFVQIEGHNGIGKNSFIADFSRPCTTSRR